jgi:hypothetical protein
MITPPQAADRVGCGTPQLHIAMEGSPTLGTDAAAEAG